MIYAKFDTEQEATLFEKTGWLLCMRTVVADRSSSDTIIDVETGDRLPLSLISDSDLNDRDRFPLFGKRQGALVKESGYTKRWSDIIIPTKPESWLFGNFLLPKPTEGAALSFWDIAVAATQNYTEIEVTDISSMFDDGGVL